MNIMLLSVSVWSGNSGDIDPTTRDFFHWLSALIALPTAAYAGRPFFESALRALRGGVPRVHLLDGRVEHALVLELFTPEGVGTMVALDDGAPAPSSDARPPLLPEGNAS